MPPKYHHTRCDKICSDCGGIKHDTNEQSSVADIYARKVEACVTITFGDGSSGGSGSFLTADGYILTAAHVILKDNAMLPNYIPRDNIMIRPKNLNGIKDLNRPVSCKYIGSNRGADIGIIKVKTLQEDPINGFNLTKQSFLKWARHDHTRNGDNILLISNPSLNGHLTPLPGVISDKRYVNAPNITAIETVLTTAQTHPGVSGSPIMKKGELIALHSFEIRGNNVRVPALSGGSSAFLARPISKFIIKNETNYQNMGYLGIKAIASMTNFVWIQIVTAANNFAKISKGNGFLIAEVDNVHVSPGRGILNATPTPLRLFDVLISLKVKGQCKIKLGEDSKDLYPISHITWLHGIDTEVEVEFIRPGETFVRTSTVILDQYPNDLDVVFTVAQSVEKQQQIEAGLGKKLKKFLKNNKV